MLITFNIYCLSNFQLYNTVSSTITTLLYITSPEIICFISGSLYPLAKISPYMPSAVPDNHHSTLFLWVWVFSDSTYKWYHKYLPYSNFKIPSSHKGQDFLFPHGWIIFHCIQKCKNAKIRGYLIYLQSCATITTTDVRIDWRLKNWCFWILLLEKTVKSPLDCKENKAVNPKGNQSWIFIRRTDAEALILWPADVKSQLFGKGPDPGKDRGQE